MNLGDVVKLVPMIAETVPALIKAIENLAEQGKQHHEERKAEHKKLMEALHKATPTATQVKTTKAEVADVKIETITKVTPKPQNQNKGENNNAKN